MSGLVLPAMGRALCGPPRSLRERAVDVPLRMFVLLLLVLLSGCARAPDEQRLREAMAGLQAAIEAREVGAAMDFVAEDFT